MGATQIRKELHQYIDKVDDRLVNLMYAMIQADQTDGDYLLSDRHKELLDQRLASHASNPSAGSSWEEVESRVRNQL